MKTVQRSKWKAMTALQLGNAVGSHFVGSNERTFVTASYDATGEKVMPLIAKDQKFFKVVHVENGRSTTRRVHTMMLQAADGRVHQLMGDALPESMTLFTGAPYTGAHLAEVLLNPSGVRAIPLGAPPKGWIAKRDIWVGLVAIFFFLLITGLVESSIIILT